MNSLWCLGFGHIRRGEDPRCTRCSEDTRDAWEIQMELENRIERLETIIYEEARKKRTEWKRKPSPKNWSPR